MPIVTTAETPRTLRLLNKTDFPGWLDQLPPAIAAWVRDHGFEAARPGNWFCRVKRAGLQGR